MWSSMKNVYGIKRKTLKSCMKMSKNLVLQRTRCLRDLYNDTDELHLICLFLIDSKLLWYEDVMKDKRWKDTMYKEINAIMRNKTWELASLPQGQNPISVKYVYKIKKNIQDQVEKYKARLVAKDYMQKFDIDYDKLFVLIIQMETIRLIIFLVAQNN